MTSQSEPSPALFTAAERDLIRRELGLRFSTFPSVADGLILRTWRGGPQTGQPRVPVAMQGLIERELVRIGADVHGRPVGLFTKAGIAALRQLAQLGASSTPCATLTSGRNSASPYRPAKNPPELCRQGQ